MLLWGDLGCYNPITVSPRICRELRWLKRHIVSKNIGERVRLLNDWGEGNDFTIYVDTCTSGMGIWVPSLRKGLRAKFDMQEIMKMGGKDMFDLESLAIVTALDYATTSIRPKPSSLVIFSVYPDVVQMFDSLNTQNEYRNSILTAFVNMTLASEISCRVFDILRKDNEIAGALSRFDNSKLHRVTWKSSPWRRLLC